MELPVRGPPQNSGPALLSCAYVGSAGLEELAPEAEGSLGKEAKKDGKAASRAQRVSETNRKIIRALASNVMSNSAALASATDAARGRGRAAHAAVLVLAHATAEASNAAQGT